YKDCNCGSDTFDLYVWMAVSACHWRTYQVEWVNTNKYIVDKALTVIDIVPSTGHALSRKDGWRPDRFPKLRLGRFGGEALSVELAAKLASAAPNAVIENVYGPTECTVDAAYYRWDRERSGAECRHGVVPIGHAGPKVTLLIVDETLSAVAFGNEGELLIAGEQVTPGYWLNREKTADAFVQLPGREGIFYRTGDLVRQDGPDKPIV